VCKCVRQEAGKPAADMEELVAVRKWGSKQGRRAEQRLAKKHARASGKQKQKTLEAGG